MKNAISFQGELGSYSHQACLDLYSNHDVVPCPTFESAIDSVNNGSSQLAMLPIENSTYGRVADIHSLLPESGLIIIKEYFLRVRISLLALPGSSLDQIKSAISHTVLLGQCRNFLKKNQITSVVGPDTAGSAKKVSSSNDNTVAALASELSGQIYGLKSLASDIEDMNHNTTRFLIMAKDLKWTEKKIKKKECMTTLVFEVRNLPAALYKALGGFATNGVNMLKLESYMVGGSFTATQFYLDIEGHPDTKPVQRAIEELKYFTSVVKVLGVYEKHPYRPKG
jgi:prephenate dehydratase